MITVDLTPLKNNDIEFGQRALTVTERYKCDWDDAVHDSYSIYVRQVQERARSIRTIRCKAEELLKETEDLKIDEQVLKAGFLCREAENV